MSHVRLRKYVWAWLVNEDDWARRLGHYTLGLSLSGLFAGGFGPKPMVPTIVLCDRALLFLRSLTTHMWINLDMI